MLNLLPLILSNQTCYNFTCGSLTSKFGCMESNTSTSNIYLEPCNLPFSYCPYTDPTIDYTPLNKTCLSLPSSPFNSSWPGDPCSSNSTCISQYCSNSICQGLLSSSICEDTGQCNPGLQCARVRSTFNCKLQLPIGNTNCQTDYDCVNYGACENNTCYSYYSRQEGEYVSECENNKNMLCESGMCHEHMCVSPNVKSYNNLPMTCQDESDCISTYYNLPPDGFNLTSSCQCGFNDAGQKFCALFPGDPVQASFRSIQLQWINSRNILNCHSYSRFSLDCIKLN